MPSPPGILSAIPPLALMSQQLKSQVEHKLVHILRSNYETRFAQVASELTAFRGAVADHIGGIDDATLCEMFKKTVQLTTYGAYSSLISKFFESPCRESEVLNLLAPGLPDYITRSSSTSGGVSKAFPKYSCLPQFGVGADTWPSASALFDSPIERVTAFIYNFMCEPLDIVDENDCLIKAVNISPTVSSLFWRSFLGLPPENDEEKMPTFLPNFVAPYAAGFVKNWSSFLIIHGLFALSNRSLEQMRMSFVTSFVEMVRYIDAEFDMVTSCIENGTIPNLDGIEHVRHHLESAISPNSERAAELREIGRPSSRLGWCSLVWPNLRSVTCTASGSFESSLPLAQSFLGPDAKIHSGVYACTEGIVAWCYDPLYLNHYKLSFETIVEFLDFSESDSISTIVQPWEVDIGKQYEVVMTNSDGLWRYRLGDVVEIAGFDPRDGTPIIQFIERRSVAFHLQSVMISEKDLRSAMTSVVVESTLGVVVEWTTTLDKNQLPCSIGFFIELANEQVCDVSLAGERILDALSQSNRNISLALAKGAFGKPIVWIVERGTFSAFRQLRLDEGSNNMGQVKVPVVLARPAHVTWFLGRVVKRL